MDTKSWHRANSDLTSPDLPGFDTLEAMIVVGGIEGVC
jgi:hypothetical protein